MKKSMRSTMKKMFLLALAVCVIVTSGVFGAKASAAKSISSLLLNVKETSRVVQGANFAMDSRWKDGSYWAGSPKISKWSSSGCCAYVSDYCKYVYGYESPKHSKAKSKFSVYSGANNIQTGDIIHVRWAQDNRYNKGGEHWIAIIARVGNDLYTAEAGSGRVTTSIKNNKLTPNYYVKNGIIYRYGDNERASVTDGYHYK